MNLVSVKYAKLHHGCGTSANCPKCDTDQQVLKNTIKLYWDARAMM